METKLKLVGNWELQFFNPNPNPSPLLGRRRRDEIQLLVHQVLFWRGKYNFRKNNLTLLNSCPLAFPGSAGAGYQQHGDRLSTARADDIIKS